MKNTTLALALGSAMILAGCGGGGDSATPVTSAPVSTLSTITSGNANNVASNAYGATTLIGDSSSSFTGMLTGVSISGGGVGVVAPVLKLIKHAGSAPQLLTGVAMSLNCSGGGTVAIDATMRSQQTLSNGDTMSVSAQNCVEDGEVVNGKVSVTFSNVTGDMLNTSTFGATLDMRFTNLSIASGSEAVSVNGDMKVAINQTNAISNSLSISGQSLQATEQRSGSTVATVTLANYTMTGSTSGNTVTSVSSFAVSGNSTALGQFSYTVKNLQPFVFTGRNVPDSGSLIVNGAASSVTLTVADSNGIRLDYSAKGDGVVTQTNTLTWAAFLALYGSIPGHRSRARTRRASRHEHRYLRVQAHLPPVWRVRSSCKQS